LLRLLALALSLPTLMVSTAGDRDVLAEIEILQRAEPVAIREEIEGWSRSSRSASSRR